MRAIPTAGVGQVASHDVLPFNGSSLSCLLRWLGCWLDYHGREPRRAPRPARFGLAHRWGSYQAYLLISTRGAGAVAGGTLNFFGEDLLGFCATTTGETTAGTWHMVLHGSTEGMPKNSSDSISASADGSVIYLATGGTFNVDTASGTHSMVYKLENSPSAAPSSLPRPTA